MGTVVAQDIFQSKLDAIFIGMEGVTGIVDDIIIAGKDEMEHDRNFLAFMEKCIKNNLTLNSEKIQFKQTQLSFYGHIWSKHSISPDSQKNTVLRHGEFPLSMEGMPFFPRETVPAGKREICIARHRKHAIFHSKSIPARNGEIHTGDQTEAIHGYMYTYIFKCLPKKRRYQDIIPRTVNMVTTHILMSVHPQDSFSKKLG